MSGFTLQNINNIWFGSFDAFNKAGFGNAFSCRLHGKSTLVPGGFNLALHVGDDARSVLENRRRYAGALQLDAEQFTACEQIHGDKVTVVDKALTGRGTLSYSEAIKGTDALVTDLAEVPLILFFADCVPVILADPAAGCIGIAHAGWRGTVADIALKTVQKMQQAFRALPQNIIAGIGPCIGQCCYEVDDTVYNAGQKHQECFKTVGEGKYMADLQEWNRQSLLEAGVLPQHIYQAGICTECNKELFFSYRAESGKTGRMGVTIWKKQNG